MVTNSCQKYSAADVKRNKAKATIAIEYTVHIEQ